MRVALAVLFLGSVAVAEPPSPTTAAPFDEELQRRVQRYRDTRGGAAAMPALLGILDLWESVEDRDALVKFIDQVSGDTAAHPEVRTRARYLRTLLLDRRGDYAAADKERAALGVIDRFVLLGPFDNEGKLGHQVAYPPEANRKAALDATPVPGKRETVAWRPLPAIAVEGMIGLESVQRPSTYATSYLATAIVAERAGPAVLRFGHQGALKIWLNDQLVFDRDRYHVARLDQRALPIALVAGPNRLLIKISAGDKAAALVVRVTDAQGALPAGVQIKADLPTINQAPHLDKPAPLRPGTTATEEALARLAQSGQPAALYDLATLVHELGLEEPERHRAESLVEQALRKQPSARGYYTLFDVSSDTAERRRALASAVQRGSTSKAEQARWLTELGDLLDQLGLERDAEARWREALQQAPDFALPRLRLADAAADQSLVGAARADVAGLSSKALYVLRERARLAARAGRADEATQLLELLLAQSPDDLEALRERFTLERRRGNLAEAARWLDQISARRPDLAFPRSERIALRLAERDLEGALRLLEAELQRAPGDAALEEQAGRLLERLGRRSEALQRLQRALGLVPQNPELRTLLAALDGSRSQALELQKKYAPTIAALQELAQRPEGKEGAARVLVDREVVHVLPQGLTESYRARAVQLLDRRALRERSAVTVQYAPSHQRFELLAARVLRPNGELVEASQVEEHDVSEPWYGLYYDMSGVRVRFDAVEPGDTILVEYLLADIGARNELGDYFGDLHSFQEDVPRLSSEYVVLLPEQRTLQVFQSDRPWLQRSEAVESGERVYRWTASLVPKIYAEPSMPGWSEVSGYVHVSTYKSWAEVAEFYGTLLRGQQEPTQAIRDATLAAIRGKKTPREKVTALYNLVVDKTRYVGLEFGIHGYQPYRVSQIFARKYGDCKDKASLLQTMLKLAGIEAELVLARTRRGGDLRDPIASLAIFDHAIVYVPSLDLYLDGTAEFSGSLELPEQDQDIVVLRIGKRQLVRTPVSPATSSQALTHWKVRLQPSGAAQVDERLVLRGQATPEWRQHYQVAGEQRDRYERAWTDRHPGASIVALKMAVSDREQPVSIDATVEAPRWARQEGPALVQRLLGREPDMLRSYARLSERRYDLIVGYPWTQTERLTITLPPGYRLSEVPKPVELRSPFGRFATQVKVVPGGVEVEATMTIDRYRIPTQDYAAFRAFCQQIDAEVGRELRFLP